MIEYDLESKPGGLPVESDCFDTFESDFWYSYWDCIYIYMTLSKEWSSENVFPINKIVKKILG